MAGKLTAMKTKNLTPIEIFKPGRHTAMNGAVLDFSEADVAATAAAYDPALHEAPFVVGHPLTDDPAYGSAKALQFADNRLLALPQDVDPQFAELVNNRRFYKVSAAFYSPDSPVNPSPGVWYLRHVGFLGAQPPAVKGLKSPSFADDGAEMITFEFGEGDLAVDPINQPTGDPLMTPEEIAAKQAELDAKQAAIKAEQDALAQDKASFAEREQALKTQESKAKVVEVTAFTETLVKEGRLLPRDQAGLVAFMSSDSAADSIEFAEDGEVIKKPGADWLRSFLKRLPVQVQFGEVDNAGAKQSAGLTDKQIASKAQAYKAEQDKLGNNISFTEAVDAVIADMGGAA